MVSSSTTSLHRRLDGAFPLAPVTARRYPTALWASVRRQCRRHPHKEPHIMPQLGHSCPMSCQRDSHLSLCVVGWSTGRNRPTESSVPLFCVQRISSWDPLGVWDLIFSESNLNRVVTCRHEQTNKGTICKGIHHQGYRFSHSGDFMQ